MLEDRRQSDMALIEIQEGVKYIKENFDKLEKKIDKHLDMADENNIHYRLENKIRKLESEQKVITVKLGIIFTAISSGVSYIIKKFL